MAPPDSQRKRLPFEPGKRKVEAEKQTASAQVTSDRADSKTPNQGQSTKVSRSSRQQTAQTAIPEVVSRRMLKRMVIFSGLPTLAGVVTFFASYFLLINEVVELPSYFVLFATLGCFGLGVLGLSYGALSASWDEDRVGHWFGVDEFRVNFSRLTGAWGSKTDS